MSTLPIDAVLGELRTALSSTSAAVLQAPPGAGKTTGVPLALLDEPWLGGQTILVLEPRRLAARAAARRMAAVLGESLGGAVGYRVRLDSRVGPRTRIEVVTEGILTRRVAHDPTLDGVGLVVFDELHERSLQADLGLALTLQTQRLLRPELRILAMSATLDGTAVAQLLGGAPVITSSGRQFPVETRYLGSDGGARTDWRRVEVQIVSAVAAALRDEPGDVLVFLPGAAEIRRVADQLAGVISDPAVTIAPLFGNLTADEQDRAILPSATGRRKVVLATSIAETSLTIEGVRVVVDSGFARVPRFSPRTGMTRLETVRVSRAAADQRRGRAGRVGPGLCLRLWSAAEHQHLLPRAVPEIRESDLAALVLELAAAGVGDPLALDWLDPPPAAALAQARELLRELEALDADQRITPHGRRMVELGLHPRLAHMLVRGAALVSGPLACALAALVSERDVLRGEEGPPDADVRVRVELVRGGGSPAGGVRVDRDALRRVRAEAAHLARQLGVREGAFEDDDAGRLLALAYPDRIAQRRDARGRYLMRNGRGAVVEHWQTIAAEEYLVIAAVDDRQADGRVFLAAPIARETIDALFAAQMTEERVVAWDDAADAVAARRRMRLGALVLADEPLRDVDATEIAGALAARMTRAGVAGLPWSDCARRLRERLRFLHEVDRSWPDVGDEALAASLDTWLAPRVVGMRSWRDVARLDLSAALLELVGRERRGAIDDLAPSHWTAPTGSRLPIDYGDPAAPSVSVRLQELFGLADTPRIARGRVPLTFHLLSPAQRPVQVTRDLAGFWRTSYRDVRKDLRGRYPKHDWPEDPLAAAPTRRAKPRR
jgi:ATP-dependent helicase HrpB